MAALTAEKVLFAVFTGTGNTLFAANALADALRRAGKTVTLIPMHRKSATEALAAAGFADGDALGLAVPLACGSTYPTAWRFIRSLPEGRGREAFLLGTMGGFSFGMQGPVGRELRRKGYRLAGARFLKACNNYVARHIPAPDALPAVHGKLRDGAEAFCTELLAGTARWGTGRWNVAASALEWFVRKRKSFRTFRRVFPLAADAAKCTGCGLCARLCPEQAITVRDGKAAIDQSPSTLCQSCQRCVGLCPAYAVGVPGKEPRRHRCVPPKAQIAFLDSISPGTHNERMKMHYPELKIKKLGFGLMRLPMLGTEVDIEQTKKMADLFLEKGFTYFDTAYGYIGGKSEESVKEVLVKRYPRDKFYLATKLPAWAGVNTAEEAQNMFWTSLKRTGAEYFDFYLLHNLGPTRIESFNKFGIWDFVREQKEKGLIRRLGFSIHATADYLEKVLTEHPELEFVQLQLNYSDWENSIIQSRRCHEVAMKFKKPIIVMEPVKGGALAKLPEAAAAVLKEANPNASQASWAIRYVASLPGIVTVLSGMSTLGQMEDNLSFMEPFAPLTDAERKTIEKVQSILASVPQIPCTDCKYCVPECPQKIGIPDIMKIMNDYNIYHRLEAAKGSYGFATKTNGKASACVTCGACEAVCPQSIKITEELKKAAGVLEA